MIKFRPSLTLPEIEHIVELLRKHGHHENSEPLHKLNLFILKARHGITAPSHAVIGQQSLEAKLGLAEDDRIETLLQVNNSTPKILSPSQLERVQFYRFQNNLMTSEEEDQYLAQLPPASQGK